MIEAAPAAGVECIATTNWEQRAPVLMTYGLGHLQRRPWQEAHKRAGGRLIGWDTGYWNRDVPLAFSMPDHRRRPSAPVRARRGAGAMGGPGSRCARTTTRTGRWSRSGWEETAGADGRPDAEWERAKSIALSALP